MTECVDLVVIGGGPAGLEASIAAAEAGVKVTLIDSYKQLGGQYFKQLSYPFSSIDQTHRQKEADALIHRFNNAGVRSFSDTLVWNACPAEEQNQWLLSLYGPGAPDSLQTKALVIAAGVYDRPVPFPGWTLPGVMTAGAVQIMLKSQRVLAGRRFLFSGTGPLQLAVAAQLVHAGAEVAEVLEANRMGFETIRHAPAMWGQSAKLLEGWEYWRTLRRAGVPLKYGHAAIKALGQEEIEAVVTARLDKEMKPIPGTEQSVNADTLVIGYGFLPSNDLTRLLGCKHDYVPEQMYHVPWRSDEMQTSLPGVYAVGDGTGVGGVQLSRHEGCIAGLAAAAKIGFLDATSLRDAIGGIQPALARERRFAKMLTRLFGIRSGFLSLADDDTLICRCEEISKKEIMDAIKMGCDSLIWTNRMTRAGMGMCQGRVCGQWIASLIAEQTGQDPSELSLDTVRPPLRPIPMNSPEVSENG